MQKKIYLTSIMRRFFNVLFAILVESVGRFTAHRNHYPWYGSDTGEAGKASTGHKDCFTWVLYAQILISLYHFKLISLCSSNSLYIDEPLAVLTFMQLKRATCVTWDRTERFIDQQKRCIKRQSKGKFSWFSKRITFKINIIHGSWTNRIKGKSEREKKRTSL